MKRRTRAEITGDGNVVGDDNIVRVFKTVVHMPVWVWMASAVILALVAIVAASIFNIDSLRELLPTPLPFKPASDGESLIVVADFEDRSQGKYHGVDPAQYIYEQLSAHVQHDGLDLRIERLRETLDDNTVRPVGNRCNATMVLWGWYDALTITPRLERIDVASGYLSYQEGLRFPLVDLRKVEFSIITDLPAHASYLSLFVLGVEATVEDNEKALAYFNSALSAIPGDPGISVNPSETHLFRGAVYGVQGEHDKALADATRALQLNPDLAAAHVLRGIVHTELDELEKALDDYERALELDPELAVYVNQGRAAVYKALDDHQRALEGLDLAAEVEPEDGDVYFNRAILYKEMGELQKAIADYTRVLELNPEDAQAYANRGNIYVTLQEFENALSDYNRALELNPGDGLAYVNRGSLYDDMGYFEKALEDYDHALLLDPRYAIAYYNRGIAYGKADELERGIADVSRALELDPGLSKAYGTRGLMYRDAGEYEKALVDLNQALQLNPDRAGVLHYARALVYRDMGQNQKALSDLNCALNLNPGVAETHYTRGSTYFETGEYVNALADFTRALELDPDYARAYYGRGRIYQSFGETERAVAEFESFLGASSDPYWRDEAEQHLRELEGD